MSSSDEREKNFSFESHPLVQMWVRHQYVKYVFPLVVMIYVVLLAYFAAHNYSLSSDHIKREFQNGNCTVFSSVKLGIGEQLVCSAINPENQFYFATSQNAYLRTVNCTLPGTEFTFHKGALDNYVGFLFAEFVIQIILPLVGTYVVLEAIYLGIAGFLVVEVGYSVENVPTIEVFKNSYRIGWHLTRWCRTSSVDDVNRGVWMTTGQLLALLATTPVIIGSGWAWSTLQNGSTQCLWSTTSFVAEGVVMCSLVIYLVFPFGYCCFHLYKLVMYGNVEELPLRHKEEFLSRRFNDKRSVLFGIANLLPLLIMAVIVGVWLSVWLSLLVAYFLVTVIPSYVPFVLVFPFWLTPYVAQQMLSCCCNCKLLDGVVTGLEKSMCCGLQKQSGGLAWLWDNGTAGLIWALKPFMQSMKSALEEKQQTKSDLTESLNAL